MRTLWIAAELGLRYEHRPFAWDDPFLKSADFRRINPAGSIPAIVDDGFALAESMAISIYLARKYGSAGPCPLYPPSLDGEMQVLKWSFWAQAHLEPWVQRDVRLAGILDAVRTACEPLVHRALQTLDQVLTDRPWLVAGHFTVADLNVAGVLSPSRSTHLDLRPHRSLRDWLDRCYQRPAALAARARFAEPPSAVAPEGSDR